MKLTYEDKVQIYELRKQGESFKRLSNQFGVNGFWSKIYGEINLTVME